MLCTVTRDLARMSSTSAPMHPAAPSSRWSIGEGPALLGPASTIEDGRSAGPPSKRRPSPLHLSVTCLKSGLGAAAAGASSEELIVLPGAGRIASFHEQGKRG